MTKTASLILILSFHLPARTAFSAEKVSIAVIDFEAKNAKTETAETVSEILRTGLVQSGRFQVVERGRLKHILDERKLQMSGVTDAGHASEIGRLLNVEKMVLGTLNRLGSMYLLTIRVVDVESGLVVLAESIECRGGEERLPRAVEDLAARIKAGAGLEGRIIRIDNRAVYIDLGRDDGLEPGHLYEALRQTDAVRDLEGRVIGMQNRVIAVLRIDRADARYAICEVVKQNENLAAGDRVRPLLEPVSEPEKKKEQEVEVPVIF